MISSEFTHIQIQWLFPEDIYILSPNLKVLVGFDVLWVNANILFHRKKIYKSLMWNAEDSQTKWDLSVYRPVLKS